MRVELQPGLPGRRWACLRPVNGHDELAIDPGVPGAETTLLSRLVVDAPGVPADPEWMRSLAVADRDRLLAAVYGACFGDEIDSVAPCVSCAASFRLALSLGELLRQTGGTRPGNIQGPDADGYYETGDAVRFRLPTIGDLERVVTLPEAEAGAWLFDHCCPGVSNTSVAEVQTAMEAMAPLLDLDIRTSCPQCGEAQTVRFSLAAFLLRALARERRFLTREVHRLALAYGWGLEEILTLSRDDRRTFVQLAEAEAGRSVRA